MNWKTYGLTACTIDLTEQCNLRCSYCFTHGNTARRLTKDMGTRIVDFFLDNIIPDANRLQIGWWGGEPLLEWRLLKELTLYATEAAHSRPQLHGKKLQFGGTTNGVLLTESKMEFCRKHAVRWVISLDGTREVHDHYRKTSRGRGSFDTILKNLKVALTIWPDTKVRFGLSRKLAPVMCEAVQELYDIGVKHFMFSPVHEEPWDEADFDGLVDQYTMLAKFIGEHKDVTFHHITDDKLNQEGYPCGAGRGYVGFSVDGRIFPCHRFNKYGEASNDKWCIGHVDSGFKPLRQLFMDYPKIRRHQCFGCPSYERCAGGCYATMADLTGSPFGTLPKHCIHYRLMYEVCRPMVSDNRLKNKGDVIGVGSGTTCPRDKG